MLAFLVIGGVGAVLLLISLVVGDALDGAFDAVGGDLLSGAALAGFLGAFGFAGALAYELSGSVAIAVGVGIAVGLAIGAAAGWVSARLRSGGDESNVRTPELLGRSGTVINAIPSDGYGEVSVVAAGHITKLNARAVAPIAPGTPVVITGVLSATSVSVEPRL